jgi:RNA polymerase sigma factor (TIGR02999 family)
VWIVAAQPVGEVTRILARIQAGDGAAKVRLLEVAYDELRALAKDLMQGERPDHTLQPTALVHEAVLRLDRDDALGRGGNRAYFFGAVARAMRRILVEYARKRRAARRGGGQVRVPLDRVIELVEQTHQVDLVALDEALQQLESLNGRQCEVVTLRFFGGLEMREIAENLGVSVSTVEKDWRISRAWLRRKLA